jgi:RNA polymerase-binding transcription factor DksA
VALAAKQRKAGPHRSKKEPALTYTRCDSCGFIIGLEVPGMYPWARLCECCAGFDEEYMCWSDCDD